MKYISVKEGKMLPGLRLVLVKGMPSPWSLAARAVFDLKGIEYAPVAQYVGRENAELMAWSGHSNAPVVAYNDERLLHTPESIILLAERLNPRPALIPTDGKSRAFMFGLLRELVGENSLAWYRRIAAMGSSGQIDGREGMAHKYGFSNEQLQIADQSCANCLTLLSQTLSAQLKEGSEYMIGKSVTALDLYAAIFLTIMIKPVKNDHIPLSEMFFKIYGVTSAPIDTAFDKVLSDYRVRILDQYVNTPMAY
jgi:glutathione S-transferase